MDITFKTVHELKVAVEAGQIEKPTFISVRNYTNKHGEVSNYLINLGTNYHNAQLTDLAMLQFVTEDAFDMSDELKPFAKEAYDAILSSARKNASEDMEDHTMMSITQREMYDTILPNIKIHKEKETLYLFGMLIRKTVITPGVYKTVNSRPLTKAKNVIRKELSTGKYRQLFLEGIHNIKINGKELIIEL